MIKVKASLITSEHMRLCWNTVKSKVSIKNVKHKYLKVIAIKRVLHYSRSCIWLYSSISHLSRLTVTNIWTLWRKMTSLSISWMTFRWLWQIWDYSFYLSLVLTVAFSCYCRQPGIAALHLPSTKQIPLNFKYWHIFFIKKQLHCIYS